MGVGYIVILCLFDERDIRYSGREYILRYFMYMLVLLNLKNKVYFVEMRVFEERGLLGFMLVFVGFL